MKHQSMTLQGLQICHLLYTFSEHSATDGTKLDLHTLPETKIAPDNGWLEY